MRQEIQIPQPVTGFDAPAPSDLFDVAAARTARPVVPLADAHVAGNAAAPRRSWLIAAIAASAIIGSLTGIAAFSLYQRGQSSKANAERLATSPAAATPLPAVVASPEGSKTTAVAAEPLTGQAGSGETNENIGAVGAETTKAARSENQTPSATLSHAAETEPRVERRAGDAAAKVNPNLEVIAAERGEEKSRRQVPSTESAAKDVKLATRNEQPVRPAERVPPTAERARRVNTPRRETPDDSDARTARPGYVDAVRRAIGDRPARRNRRVGEPNGDRLREIFEGQPPQR